MKKAAANTAVRTGSTVENALLTLFSPVDLEDVVVTSRTPVRSR
jgi:hypothetical protein